MTRVNISIPDELHRRAKEAGLNISRLTRKAIVAELERLAKIAAVEEYIAELEAEQGPPTEQEMADAKAWIEQVYGPHGDRQTA